MNNNENIKVSKELTDFLNMFNFPFEYGFENGDAIINVDHFNKKKLDIKDMYVSSGLGIFGVTYAIPEFVEKINFEQLQKEDDNFFAILNVIQFLGLPGEDWKNEIEELKNFLIWFKEESMKNLGNRIGFSLERIGEEVSFKISSDNSILENEMNETMNKKISSSSILNKWLENQKKGFQEVEKQCYDLWIVTNVTSLMNFEERKNYLKIKPIKKSENIKKKKFKN